MAYKKCAIFRISCIGCGYIINKTPIQDSTKLTFSRVASTYFQAILSAFIKDIQSQYVHRMFFLRSWPRLAVSVMASVRPFVCPIFFLALIDRAAHTQCVSPGADATRPAYITSRPDNIGRIM